MFSKREPLPSEALAWFSEQLNGVTVSGHAHVNRKASPRVVKKIVITAAGKTYVYKKEGVTFQDVVEEIKKDLIEKDLNKVLQKMHYI